MNEMDHLLKYRINKDKSNIILVIVPNFTLIKKYADKLNELNELNIIRKVEYTKRRIVLTDGRIVKFMTKDEIYIGKARGMFFEEANFYE